LGHDPVGLKSLLFPKLSDRADILFTTGTTGTPKGVILTHQNILASATNINTFIQNTREDIELIPLSLSHSFGLGRLRCNFLLGASIVLANGFLLPGKIFRQLTETKASGISFVPAGAAVLFKFGGEKLGNFRDQLRYVEIGSAPMPLEHKQKLMELLPKTRICMHYGLTEASRSSFLEFHEDAEHLESIGRATPGVRIQVQDKRGEPCQTGVRGSIQVCGSSVTKEYLTSETINLVNGWFTTGDFGYQDEKGYLYLEGRESDLINVAGRKVSPIELETILNQLPSVEDVACVGMADPKGISGEVVKVFLVPKSQGYDVLRRPTRSDLVAYLRNKVEPYKIPFEFEWIERLPKTSSGKIKRYLLRKKPEELKENQ
jgi:long-chain acyl-CoA synthetase